MDPPSLADDADLTALSAPVDDESTGDGRLIDNKMYLGEKECECYYNEE